jgi:hypothetical protein
LKLVLSTTTGVLTSGRLTFALFKLVRSTTTGVLTSGRLTFALLKLVRSLTTGVSTSGRLTFALLKLVRLTLARFSILASLFPRPENLGRSPSAKLFKGCYL